jgi:RNA polymerase sigma-70 factor (ECF subfamily)
MAAISGSDPRLARALEEARAAWPDLDVPAAVFGEALAAAVAAGPPEDPLAGVHVADLYLACGCALGRPAATRIFIKQHLAAVPRYLAHLEPAAALAEDVTQELADKLLVARPPDPPRIAGYGGRGPLDRWVAVAAQRAALSHLRRRDPPAASSLEGAVAAGLDPEARLVKAELKHHFDEALRVALATLGPRDRMLLRLNAVSGLSCAKIGAIYGVNASTVSRWIVRVRSDLLDQIQRHLQRTGALDGSQLGSLLGLARSQIELHLSAHDGQPDGEPEGID